MLGFDFVRSSTIEGLDRPYGVLLRWQTSNDLSMHCRPKLSRGQGCGMRNGS